VDGDGFSDLLARASAWDDDRGAAWLFPGSTVGVSTARIRWMGDDRASSFAASAFGAGDLDGDGFDDVMVTAHEWNDAQGEVLVYAGSSSGPAGTATWTVPGDTSGGRFGDIAAPLGDANGDGWDNVIASAGSSLEVRYGSSSGATDLGPLDVNALSAAGDLNADGWDDLVLGIQDRRTSELRVHLGGDGGIDVGACMNLEDTDTETVIAQRLAETGDTTPPVDTADAAKNAPMCGCATSAPFPSPALALLALLGLRRRR